MQTTDPIITGDESSEQPGADLYAFYVDQKLRDEYSNERISDLRTAAAQEVSHIIARSFLGAMNDESTVLTIVRPNGTIKLSITISHNPIS